MVSSNLEKGLSRWHAVQQELLCLLWALNAAPCMYRIACLKRKHQTTLV